MRLLAIIGLLAVSNAYADNQYSLASAYVALKEVPGTLGVRALRTDEQRKNAVGLQPPCVLRRKKEEADANFSLTERKENENAK